MAKGKRKLVLHSKRNRGKRVVKEPDRLIANEAEGADGSAQWAEHASEQPQQAEHATKKISSHFEPMDVVRPKQEVGRKLDLPGGLFSSGKNKNKVSRLCEIIAYDPKKQLKDSIEPAFQFKDSTDQKLSWVSMQRIRRRGILGSRRTKSCMQNFRQWKKKSQTRDDSARRGRR